MITKEQAAQAEAAFQAWLEMAGMPKHDLPGYNKHRFPFIAGYMARLAEEEAKITAIKRFNPETAKAIMG